MSEDGQIIKPEDIGIEPETVIHEKSDGSVMGGLYAAPWGSSTGNHEIFIDTIDSERSATLQRITRAADNIRNPNQTTEINGLFSASEREVVASRLEEISEKLLMDEAYRKSMVDLMRMHEEMHRLREVRIPSSGFNVEDSVMDHLADGMDDEEDYSQLLNNYYKGLNQFAIYDETYAQIGGIRNAYGESDQDVRRDFVFMSFAFSAQELLASSEPDILGSLYKVHQNPTIPFLLPSHELSKIIIASGAGDLSAKAMRGEISESEYKQIARTSIKRAVLTPESILFELDNKNSLVIEVDRCLGDSARLVNESVLQMNSAYENSQQSAGSEQ